MVTVKRIATLPYRVVRRWWFERRVESGRFPLYRFCVAALLVSSGLQIVTWEVPISVRSETPNYFDAIYMFMQFAGAAVIGASLLFGGPGAKAAATDRALHLERIGCCLTVPACFVSFITSWARLGEIPLSVGSYLTLAFGAYAGYRIYEISAVFAISAVPGASARLIEPGGTVPPPNLRLWKHIRSNTLDTDHFPDLTPTRHNRDDSVAGGE